MMHSKNSFMFVFFLFVALVSIYALKTPVNGEIQLINKIYIMLMICYFVLDQFGVVMNILKREIKFRGLFEHYLKFFSVTGFILMIVNRLGDMIYSKLDISLSNPICFFVACILVFCTWAAIKAIRFLK